jgi:hypothetical protein
MRPPKAISFDVNFHASPWRKSGRIQSAAAPVPPVPPVAGPLIWLDANQEGYSNNDPVTSFTDWSGNGNNFTASGTARPTFKTNRINGRPTVQADGVDDGMLLASLGAQSAWSVFFVGCLVSYTGNKNILAVDDYNPDGAYCLFQQSAPATANVNATPGAINQVGSGVGLKTAFKLTGNSTVGTIRASDNTGGQTSANYSKASAPMRLFRRGDGLYANYEISELLMYPSVLGTTDATTIWTYFNTRYGTAIPATP